MSDIHNLRSVAVMIAGVLVLWAAPCTARSKAAPPDSGVFGVVPEYAEDLAFLEHELDSAKKALASTTDKAFIDFLNEGIREKQTSIENMRNRCVQAFDPASELPIAYLWFGQPTALGLGTFASCWDRRFPTNFTKAVATVSCGSDGAFRLPLAPGRYAVSVGRLEVDHSRRPYPWWEFVEVKPHEWKQLVPRKDNGSNDDSCEDDSDCSNGLVCRTKLPQGTKACQPRRRLLPPNYDSGVRGLAPFCGLGPFQCVEAFAEDRNHMAACGLCSGVAPLFEMPLAPGRYTLEFANFGYNLHRTVAVEIAPDEWKELNLLAGGKPGLPAVAFPECLNPKPAP